MWWKPGTDSELRMADLLTRLEKQFIKSVSEELVFGVGCFLGEELRPLLLVNGYSVGFYGQVVDWKRLPPAVENLLTPWELPEDTRFLPVTPPEPLSALTPQSIVSGAAIRCQSTHKRATLCVAVTDNASPNTAPNAFLTVGHLAPQGSTIELIERSWLSPTRYHPIGQVIRSSDPANSPGQPGYAAAVVDLSSGLIVRGSAHKGVAAISSPLHQPLLATLFGGVSGIVAQVGLCGSLVAYGGINGIWKNSWLVLPSGLISAGDSGSMIVTDATNNVAGMIVGGSRIPNSNVYMAQYAHDMESLERDVLIPAGYSVG